MFSDKSINEYILRYEAVNLWKAELCPCSFLCHGCLAESLEHDRCSVNICINGQDKYLYNEVNTITNQIFHTQFRFLAGIFFLPWNFIILRYQVIGTPVLQLFPMIRLSKLSHLSSAVRIFGLSFLPWLNQEPKHQISLSHKKVWTWCWVMCGKWACPVRLQVAVVKCVNG